MRPTIPVRLTGLALLFCLGLGFWLCLSGRVQAQSPASQEAPRYQVDPYWPKPLPDRWVTGEIGGVCVDRQDHAFTLNRGDLTPAEQITATAAPPVTEFDPEGNLVNSWGDRSALPKRLHGCFVDYQNNVWIGGSEDGVYQKYTHDGSKMLFQIGTKGKVDTSDGTLTGAPMNSSHTLLNLPASIAVDPADDDIYIADGYGNRRVVVFDSTGHFLRQWGRQGTVDEVDSGMGGVFLKVVHCVVLGNDGLVYVCDRLGGRIEVFDKMGDYKRSIPVESKNARATGVGSACWMGFSPDQAQKFIIAGTCVGGEIKVLDHATGRELSSSGRPGNQAGEFGSVHSLAVNSKGDVIVGDAANGRRIQLWRLIR